jgi:hypothetical protein
VIAATLAAAAGGTGLSNALSPKQVAVLALASAVAAGLDLGLGAARIADTEQKAALAFATLQTDARNWRTLMLSGAIVPDANRTR